MQINIFNLNNQKLTDEIDIRRLIRKILKEEGYPLNSLNIIFANDKYLKDLNKKFFNKNLPTNVISFNMDDVSEIYVSLDQVKKRVELYYYIIHGLLHIIGYDHQRKKEEELMNKKCWAYLNQPI